MSNSFQNFTKHYVTHKKVEKTLISHSPAPVWSSGLFSTHVFFALIFCSVYFSCIEILTKAQLQQTHLQL